MTAWSERLDRARAIRLAILLGGMVAMAGILLWLGRGLTFWYDEWTIILDRPDPSVTTLFTPHVDHLVVVPVLLYEALLRTVGLGTYWPYLAVAWACHFVCVVALYRIVSATAAPWLGLAAALSLLFLGSAFEDLLHAFQSSFLISVAAGLLAIGLFRVTTVGPGRTLAATVLLVVAVASSSVGVVITGLVLVWGVAGRRPPLVISGLVVAGLYATWYLTFGRSGSGPIGDPLGDPMQVVAYLGVGLGAAIAAPLGLPPAASASIGLVIGGVAAMRGALAGLRPTALGIAAIAALCAQLGLQALFRSGLGIEHAARSGYLYPAAVFLWIVVADLCRDHVAHRSRATGLAVAALLALAIVGNLAQLRGAGGAMVGLRSTILAELRFGMAVRDTPGLALDIPVDPELLPQVTLRRYLAAVDRFGAPRIALEEGGFRIAARADAAAVNATAIRLLGPAFQQGTPDGASLSATVTSGTVTPAPGGCISVAPSAPATDVRLDLDLESGRGFRVAAEPGVIVDASLGILSNELTPIAAEMSAIVRGPGIVPPPLRAGGIWHASLSSAGTFEVCPVGAT
jgi:hypothetical protein